MSFFISGHNFLSRLNVRVTFCCLVIGVSFQGLGARCGDGDGANGAGTLLQKLFCLLGGAPVRRLIFPVLKCLVEHTVHQPLQATGAPDRRQGFVRPVRRGVRRCFHVIAPLILTGAAGRWLIQER